MTTIEKMDKYFSPESVVVLIIAAIFAGIVFGWAWTESRLRSEAVNMGVGEYYFDSHNVRLFRWKGAADEHGTD